MARKNNRRPRRKFTPPPPPRSKTTGGPVANSAMAPTTSLIGRGGYANPATGAGYSRDKSQQGYYLPSWFTRPVLENLYIESGAVRKFIDIPVDDMFIRWRAFTGDDPDIASAMLQGERDLDLVKSLAQAMKAARLYGTALLIPVTKENTLDTPLNIQSIRAGDLTHLWVCNRYECHSSALQRNPLEPGYGRPIYYRITTRYGGVLNVHRSRALRFDGIAPLTSDGFHRQDQEWGMSSLHGVLSSIMQSAGSTSDITQMITESNLKVMQVNRLSDAVGQQYANDPEDFPLSQRHEMNLQNINAFNMVYIDRQDNFLRVSQSLRRPARTHRPPRAADCPGRRHPGDPLLRAVAGGNERDWRKRHGELRDAGSRAAEARSVRPTHHPGRNNGATSWAAGAAAVHLRIAVGYVGERAGANGFSESAGD